MAEHELETRLRSIEHEQIEMRGTLKYIKETLDKMVLSYQAAAEVKGKVDDHHGQLKKVWEKLDDMVDLNQRVATMEVRNTERELERGPRIQSINDLITWKNTLSVEHANCMKRLEAQATWFSGRLGALVDKLLPIIIGGGAAYLLMLASKGGH